jgi:hypothetical protein
MYAVTNRVENITEHSVAMAVHASLNAAFDDVLHIHASVSELFLYKFKNIVL